MKNVFKMIVVAMMMAVVFSCEKNETPDKVNMKDSAMTFTADFLGATKTNFNEGKLTWEAGDQIAVCDGSKVETVTLTSDDIINDGASAEIKTTTLATDAVQYYAVFPADCAYTVVDNSIDKTFIKDGCIQISSGTINIFKSHTFKSYAVALEAGGHFQFKNVGAIVYFKTERTDIYYVTFESNESGDVRGNVLIDPATGEITHSDYFEHSVYSVRTDIITYDMWNEKEAYIPVSAGITLVGGYTLTAYDGFDNVIGTISTNSDLTFENGKYYTIKNFDTRLQAPLPDTPDIDGALLGKFTINEDGDQVYFSKGNLYWDGDSFEFETNQYDYPSWEFNSNHVGHFYWSIDASQAYTKFPEIIYETRFGFGNFFTNSTAETANPDFTVNDIKGKYRTLSKDEWRYLLDNHEHRNAGVNDVLGLVIAPDDFDGELLDRYADDAALATYNLVFLPYAGKRSGDNTDKSGSCGQYWSASLERVHDYDDEDRFYFYYIYFRDDDISVVECNNFFHSDSHSTIEDLQQARAVRLVADVTE